MDQKGIIAGGYVTAIIDPNSAPPITNFTPSQPGQVTIPAPVTTKAITSDTKWFDK